MLWQSLGAKKNRHQYQIQSTNKGRNIWKRGQRPWLEAGAEPKLVGGACKYKVSAGARVTAGQAWGDASPRGSERWHNCPFSSLLVCLIPRTLRSMAKEVCHPEKHMPLCRGHRENNDHRCIICNSSQRKSNQTTSTTEWIRKWCHIY
jgi:hypothetical protein